MNRFTKTVLTGTCLLLAICMVSLVSVYTFLKSDFARIWIQEKINGAIPGTIEWQRQTIAPLSGRAEVEGLFLYDREGETIVSLPKLAVAVAWSDVLRGIVSFESILVDGLTVQLRIDSKGRLNLLESLLEPDVPPQQNAAPQRKSEKIGFPFNVTIRKAVLRNGNLQYDENTAHRLNLPKIDLAFENGDLQKQEITVSGTFLQPEIDFEQAQVQFTKLQLAGVYAQDQIPRVSISGETVAGTRFAASGKVTNLYEKIEPDGTVEVDGHLTDILKVFSADADMEGRIAGTVSIRGGLDNPMVSLSATCRNADFYGTKMDQLETATQWKDGVVTVKGLTVKARDSVLQIGGKVDLRNVLPDGFLSDSVDLDQIQYQLDGALQADQVGVQPESPDGVIISVNSRFTVNGEGISSSARSGRATLEGKIRELKEEDAFLITDVSVSALVDYKNQNLDIARLDIQAGDENQLSGNGMVNLDSETITGKVSVAASLPSDRITIPAIAGLKGVLHLTGSIAGNMDDPKIDGSFQVDELSYQDVRIGTVAADYAFSRTQLGVQNAWVRNADSILGFSGTIFSPNPEKEGGQPEMAVAIHGDSLFLQDFLPELEGKVAINGNLSGEMTGPQGDLQIDAEALRIYGQTIKAVNLTLHVDKAKIKTEGARITVREEEEVRVSGWISPGLREYGLRVSSDGISLKNIDSISGMDWGAARVDLSVAGQGHFDQPAMSGTVGVTALFAGEKGADRFEAKIDFSDRRLHLTESGGEDVSAIIDFNSGKMDANANLQQVQLAPWLKMAGLDQFSGRMDISLAVKGQYADVKSISARAIVSDATVLWEEKELLHADRLHVNMKDGKLDVPQNRLTIAKTGYLDVTGTAAVSGSVNAHLSGSLPAGILKMASDEISDMEGAILLSAAIEGTWENPTVRSSITARNVRGRIPYLSEELRDLKGEIRITPHRIEVKGLEGRSGAGWIALNGPVDIVSYPEVTAELTLRSHALPVEISDLSLLLNAGLTLRLGKESRRLAGEIIILEGEYTRDVDINPIAAVTEKTRKVELLEKDVEQGLLDSIEMDIVIKGRNAMVVDNNISLLQLKPDLHVRGSAVQPVFTGRAEVESGTISYQKKEFSVTKGVVDFINPYKIEPLIDVKGETQVRQWKIYLTVKGIPENLKITLRSEPVLPNGDILSLLVFGKTVREFIEREGGQSISPAELAAALMSDRLQSRVKDATGLDSVEVGYSSNGTESDSSQMKVEVGKDFSRYVTVKYGIETTNSKIVQRATTEYRFLEHLILEAYQNSEGNYGGELQYRLEFR